MNEWISTKDKLPEEYHPVLILVDNSTLLEGMLDVDKWCYAIPKKRGKKLIVKVWQYNESLNITHWMEKPKHPKE